MGDRKRVLRAVGLIALVTGLAAGEAVGAGAAKSRWSIQPSPNPPGATSSVLAGVSCSGSSACTAVGHDTVSDGASFPLAERWDGGSWSIQPTPSPSGASGYLTGVSCAGPAVCTAVGYSVGSAVQALVEQWDGTAWTIQPTPAPLRASWWELSGVSCRAPFDCTAVGGSIGRSVDAQEKPLAEHWDGSAWTIEPTPNPRAENGSDLGAVACAGSIVCEAVGGYAFADTLQSVFAFGWNGTSWTHQHQPNPGGSDPVNTDSSVSCSSPAACTSVGSWTDADGRLHGLAARWDGTSWTHQFVPNHTGFLVSELFGVSCAGGASCTAVGDWATGYYPHPSLTLAEKWDGTAWMIEPTPNPAGGILSSLDGVECVAPRTCVAVGSSYDGSVTHTLVEARAP
jgi:hypothetical protein